MSATQLHEHERFNQDGELLIKTQGAEDPPGRVERDRSEIERIKQLLRAELGGVPEPLFGAGDAPLAAGRAILGRIVQQVEKELAVAASGEANQ